MKAIIMIYDASNVKYLIIESMFSYANDNDSPHTIFVSRPADAFWESKKNRIYNISLFFRDGKLFFYMRNSKNGIEREVKEYA